MTWIRFRGYDDPPQQVAWAHSQAITVKAMVVDGKADPDKVIIHKDGTDFICAKSSIQEYESLPDALSGQ